jgi:hypothetical protein
MPLNTVQLSNSFAWQLQNGTSTGFEPVTQGTDNIQVNLQGIQVTTWNQLFAANYSLSASGGTTTFDLTSFTNLAFESVTLGHVLAIVVDNTTATGTGSNVAIGPASSDGLQWFWGGTSQTISLPDGYSFVLTGPVGGTSVGTAVSGTSKKITLTNNGSGAATVQIAILGSTT